MGKLVGHNIFDLWPNCASDRKVEENRQPHKLIYLDPPLDHEMPSVVKYKIYAY